MLADSEGESDVDVDDWSERSMLRTIRHTSSLADLSRVRLAMYNRQRMCAHDCELGASARPCSAYALEAVNRCTVDGKVDMAQLEEEQVKNQLRVYVEERRVKRAAALCASARTSPLFASPLTRFVCFAVTQYVVVNGHTNREELVTHRWYQMHRLNEYAGCEPRELTRADAAKWLQDYMPNEQVDLLQANQIMETYNARMKSDAAVENELRRRNTYWRRHQDNESPPIDLFDEYLRPPHPAWVVDFLQSELGVDVHRKSGAAPSRLEMDEKQLRRHEKDYPTELLEMDEYNAWVRSTAQVVLCNKILEEKGKAANKAATEAGKASAASLFRSKEETMLEMFVRQQRAAAHKFVNAVQRESARESGSRGLLKTHAYKDARRFLPVQNTTSNWALHDLQEEADGVDGVAENGVRPPEQHMHLYELEAMDVLVAQRFDKKTSNKLFKLKLKQPDQRALRLQRWQFLRDKIETDALKAREALVDMQCQFRNATRHVQAMQNRKAATKARLDEAQRQRNQSPEDLNVQAQMELVQREDKEMGKALQAATTAMVGLRWKLNSRKQDVNGVYPHSERKSRTARRARGKKKKDAILLDKWKNEFRHREGREARQEEVENYQVSTHVDKTMAELDNSDEEEPEGLLQKMRRGIVARPALVAKAKEATDQYTQRIDAYCATRVDTAKAKHDAAIAALRSWRPTERMGVAVAIKAQQKLLQKQGTAQSTNLTASKMEEEQQVSEKLAKTVRKSKAELDSATALQRQQLRETIEAAEQKAAESESKLKQWDSLLKLGDEFERKATTAKLRQLDILLDEFKKSRPGDPKLEPPSEEARRQIRPVVISVIKALGELVHANLWYYYEKGQALKPTTQDKEELIEGDVAKGKNVGTSRIKEPQVDFFEGAPQLFLTTSDGTQIGLKEVVWRPYKLTEYLPGLALVAATDGKNICATYLGEVVEARQNWLNHHALVPRIKTRWVLLYQTAEAGTAQYDRLEALTEKARTLTHEISSTMQGFWSGPKGPALLASQKAAAREKCDASTPSQRLARFRPTIGKTSFRGRAGGSSKESVSLPDLSPASRSIALAIAQMLELAAVGQANDQNCGLRALHYLSKVCCVIRQIQVKIEEAKIEGGVDLDGIMGSSVPSLDRDDEDDDLYDPCMPEQILGALDGPDPATVTTPQIQWDEVQRVYFDEWRTVRDIADDWSRLPLRLRGGGVITHGEAKEYLSKASTDASGKPPVFEPINPDQWEDEEDAAVVGEVWAVTNADLRAIEAAQQQLQDGIIEEEDFVEARRRARTPLAVLSVDTRGTAGPRAVLLDNTGMPLLWYRWQGAWVAQLHLTRAEMLEPIVDAFELSDDASYERDGNGTLTPEALAALKNDASRWYNKEGYTYVEFNDGKRMHGRPIAQCIEQTTDPARQTAAAMHERRWQELLIWSAELQQKLVAAKEAIEEYKRDHLIDRTHLHASEVAFSVDDMVTEQLALPSFLAAVDMDMAQTQAQQTKLDQLKIAEIDLRQQFGNVERELHQYDTSTRDPVVEELAPEVFASGPGGARRSSMSCKRAPRYDPARTAQFKATYMPAGTPDQDFQQDILDYAHDIMARHPHFRKADLLSIPGFTEARLRESTWIAMVWTPQGSVSRTPVSQMPLQAADFAKLHARQPEAKHLLWTMKSEMTQGFKPPSNVEGQVLLVFWNKRAPLHTAEHLYWASDDKQQMLPAVTPWRLHAGEGEARQSSRKRPCSPAHRLQSQPQPQRRFRASAEDVSPLDRCE